MTLTSSKILPGAIILAQILLFAPLAAVAQTAAPPPATTAATKDETSMRQKVSAEMQEWQRKIDAFGSKTKAAGKDASANTKAAFDDAWAKTKVAAERVQNATADGWADAKKYYDAQAANLSAAWERMNSGGN
jgi:hypothetical protein